MQKIIKDNAIIEDHWLTISLEHEGPLPEGQLLLPLKAWLEKRFPVNEADSSREIGLWLDSDDELSMLAETAQTFPVIAINFPAFMDGRGFSLARQLREQLGYQGEIRAIGGAIRDQLFYLKRCGFNAFDLGDQTALDEALSSLNDFSVTYQSSVEQPEPLFRRQ